jgi:hypothetical protein
MIHDFVLLNGVRNLPETEATLEQISDAYLPENCLA